MALPGLHVVTDDEVLAAHGFHDRALRLVKVHGPRMALHVRGPRTPAARLYEIAARLAPAAREAGAPLLINDRADIALAVEADGVHLGTRSLPVAAIRSIRADWLVGASVHGLDEAMEAGGADFLVLGTIWSTPSHPGRAGAGLAALAETAAAVGIPVIAIGGVTPERAASARRAGAAGVAVLRGIWAAEDLAAAASSYLEAMDEGEGGGG